MVYEGEGGGDVVDAISKKYTKFSKNEKNELSNNYWVNVCFESNVIDVSSDTWWLDVVLPFTFAILCKR